MPPDSEVCVVATTFPDEPSAAKVIRQLVREHLIACGTMNPGCRSIYVWDDKPEDNEEVSVVMKTVRARLPELEARLAELHSYEVSEFLVFQPSAVSMAYGDWVSSYCNPVS